MSKEWYFSYIHDENKFTNNNLNNIGEKVALEYSQIP
jgi:hypothetical protein